MSSFSEKRRYLGAWTAGIRLLELSAVLKQLHQQAADTDRWMLKDIQADILPDGRVETNKGRENRKGNGSEGEGQKKSKLMARS